MQGAQAGLNDTLNDLLEVHNDRISGYQASLEKTDDKSLRTLFNEMIDHSKKMRDELSEHIKAEGGEPKLTTSGKGKIYQLWMDVKTAVSVNKKKAVLGSCVTGERAALSTYDITLHRTDIPIKIRELLQKQRNELQEDYLNIESLFEKERDKS